MLALLGAIGLFYQSVKRANMSTVQNIRRRKAPLRDQPYIFAHEAQQWTGCVLHDEVDKICARVEAQRVSTRGVFDSQRQKVRSITEWFLNCLIQTEETFPRSWLAIGMSSSYFGPAGPLQGKIGYDLFVKRLIPAMESLGWISIRKGFFDKTQQNSRLSRIRAKGKLRYAISQVRYLWQQQSPTDQGLILLFDGKKKDRRLIETPSTKEVDRWRNDLHDFNKFLCGYSICLAIPDYELNVIAKRLNQRMEARLDRRKPVLNYRAVTLRRIFARGRLDRGGRFYGGWWQHVPSEYRRHITINGKKTNEWDFSSMALRLLYAHHKADPGVSDLYDVGLGTQNRNVRSVIKLYINALLNDESGRFKLAKHEINAVGVSQRELKDLVLKRHPIIRQHLRTGIGLYLQFLESEIAFHVMLEMMRGHNTPVLPIHDSFLVRNGYTNELAKQMQDSFQLIAGQSATLSVDRFQTHPAFVFPTDDSGLMIPDFKTLQSSLSSICSRYNSSNPNAIFD